MGNDCFSLIRCFYSMLSGEAGIYAIPASVLFAGAKVLTFLEICNT